MPVSATWDKKAQVSGRAIQLQRKSARDRAQAQKTCDHCHRPWVRMTWESSEVLRLECAEHYAGPRKGGRR